MDEGLDLTHTDDALDLTTAQATAQESGVSSGKNLSAFYADFHGTTTTDDGIHLTNGQATIQESEVSTFFANFHGTPSPQTLSPPNTNLSYIPPTPTDIWQTKNGHMVSTTLIISSAVQNKRLLYLIMLKSLPLKIICQQWFSDLFKNLYK